VSDGSICSIVGTCVRKRKRTVNFMKNSGKKTALTTCGSLYNSLGVTILLTGVFVTGLAQSPKLLYRSDDYTVWSDRVDEHDYSARALSPTEIESNYPTKSGVQGAVASHWVLHEDLGRYPQSTSNYRLLDALYNLSLEELELDTRPDGTFNAGAKWPGVWTRDVSYSILLSLAAIEPEAAKQSLLRKVKRERIVQDTGTGGSWPVSTDRECWALAAWEVYLVTGDRQWLQQSFSIIQNSIHDDEMVVMDPVTGLARGESSFMDWREQTYPRWMEPADIYSSENLGTNAVFYRVYRVLSEMASEIGQPSEEWSGKADRIRSSINQQLWQDDLQLYGQYLYGRIWQTLSPRSDAFGEALSILFDVADPQQQDAILQSQPLMPYGIPTVYPETPGISPYHNRSVWPFVQAFWNLAEAKRGNDNALLYGLASIYRSSALLLTNNENFVADTGSPIGSDRQLWSVAGNLAMTYRVLFGMEFTTAGLRLHPVIPKPLTGTRKLTNFHYRGAVLSIVVKGFGNNVRSLTLDGKAARTVISTTLIGPHTIVMQMDNRQPHAEALSLAQNLFAPDTPVVIRDGDSLTWKLIKDTSAYQVYKNGKPIQLITNASFTIPDRKELTSYQVSAISDRGTPSFLSAPVITSGEPIILSAVPADPQSFVTLEQTGTTNLAITGNVATGNRYSIVVRYANGSGPVNTDNKCAVRTLFIDGQEVGPIIMPQRGREQWLNWGLSNGQFTHLTQGEHNFELRFLPSDINMNGEVNRVAISAIILTPLN
jgi:Bacterial alpha-L-rhamnosidase 6 hairpin glycosidase domain